MLIQIPLDQMDYGVTDGEVSLDPSVPPIKVKVLTVLDKQSNVTFQMVFPAEPPPGQTMPPEFVPPAQDLANRLMDKKVTVEVARTMPTAPPPGGLR